MKMKTTVSTKILENEKVSPEVKLVYIALEATSYNRKSKATKKTLSKMTGYPEKTIIAKIQELEELDYVEIETDASCLEGISYYLTDFSQFQY